jgi:hypothetical protein
MTALRLIAAALAASSLAAACSPAAPKGEATAPATATPASATAPAQSPRAFVEDLYGQYKKDQSFSPFTHQEQWFDADLIAAIKEDETLANGEVGAVDGDPICSCQDTGGMDAQVQGVEQTSPTTAVATVQLWANSPDARPLKVDLVVVGGQWRVHDVHSVNDGQEESFLTYVRAENAKARAAKP